MKTYRSSLPPPSFLGLPDTFKEYRQPQADAVFDILDSTRRVRVLDAPTGFGKSLIPPTIAAMTGSRVLILVGTKILEDLYETQLGAMGLVDVRGASNYACPALKHNEFGRIGYSVLKNMKRSAGAHASDPTADHGPCRVGVTCRYRSDGCPRFDAIRAAREAQIVVTNYAYWLSIGKKLLDDGEDETLGTFDWIFLDEVHLADDQVCNTMTAEVSQRHLQLVTPGITPPSSNDISEWKSFARETKVRVSGRYDELKLWLKVEAGRGTGSTSDEPGSGIGKVFEELRTLKNLDRSLDHIITAEGRIVVSKRMTTLDGPVFKFEPVYSAPYTDRLLLRGIPNVVGMSATVRPMTMQYLGIGEDQFEFHEYPSTFPISNRPIYLMPKYRAHWKMSEGDVRQMVAVGDNIFRTRDDRRTIVHSVSYERARQLASLSRYGSRIVTHGHGSEETTRALRRFTHGPENGIFISPAIDTGYDLPDDDAEVCWIPKTPYPSMESEVMKIRAASDKMYILHYASTKIVQMAGRIVRKKTDRGETFITDSSAGGLFRHGSRLFPKWFLNATRWVTNMPAPLRKVR